MLYSKYVYFFVLVGFDNVAICDKRIFVHEYLIAIRPVCTRLHYTKDYPLSGQLLSSLATYNYILL